MIFIPPLKNRALVTCLIAGFLLSAGLAVSMTKSTCLATLSPRTVALSADAVEGAWHGSVQVKQIEILPAYREALPKEAQIDQEIFRPSRLGQAYFEISTRGDGAVAILPSVRIPIGDEESLKLWNHTGAVVHLALADENERSCWTNSLESHYRGSVTANVVALRPAGVVRQRIVVRGYATEVTTGTVRSFDTEHYITFTPVTPTLLKIKIEENEYSPEGQKWRR
ncbi:MAG: hypothetical protein K8F91_12435, partial [Candidatus Obscuribacterales bacterium]|nr:hypothetical protein [Candidatus Obscuribacterales bacterium]